MIFKRIASGSGLLLMTLMLSACPGNDDNAIEPGLVLHLGEIHLEESVSASSMRLQAGTQPADMARQPALNAVSAPAGYDIANLDHHQLADGSGHQIAVYRAYIVLDELQLIPCNDLASLPGRLLSGLISSAQAHAGHGSEPVGGRSLDLPNVIDLLSADGFTLALGDQAVAPGRYCGLQVTLTRLASSGYGKPEPAAGSTDDPATVVDIPELAGHMFAFRADYCVARDGGGDCLQRSRLDFDDQGRLAPVTRELAFSTPLVINAQLRDAFAIVGIYYQDWFRDLDLTQVDQDPEVLQTLLENIAASLHVYQKGVGNLPANISGS